MIHPIGFSLSDRKLRRAGLDYHDLAIVEEYQTLDDALRSIAASRLFTLSTHNTVRYDTVRFGPSDAFLFGPETTGLPSELRLSVPPHQQITIPMKADNRSINLSNSVAVILFEAWRQMDFR